MKHQLTDTLTNVGTGTAGVVALQELPMNDFMTVIVGIVSLIPSIISIFKRKNKQNGH